jgi:hypothetical protein
MGDFNEFKDVDDPITEADSFAEFGDAEPKSNISDLTFGFGGGFNLGLTQTIGAPVDLTNALLSVIGLDREEQFMGSKWLQRQAGKLTTIPGSPLRLPISNYPIKGDLFVKGPDTPVGRVVSRAGQELGATVPIMGGMLRAARGAVVATETGKGFVRKTLLDPISKAPLATTAGETAAAVGAGVGAGIAQEEFPESQVAETTGQIVGGIAPTLLAQTPTAWIARLTRRLTSRFSTKGQTKASKAVVSKIIGSNMDDKTRQQIQEAERLSEKIPGFKPSIAEASKNKALLLQQEFIEDQATGKFLDESIARRETNDKAITDFARKPFNDVDTGIEYVVNESDKRFRTIGAKIEKVAGKVVQKKEDLANNLPTIDKIQNGQALRDGISEARSVRSAEMSAHAQDLNIADAEFTGEFKVFQKQLEEAYAPKSRFRGSKENYPEILKQIINDEADLTTFQDIKAIRENINDDIMDELASSNPKRGKVRTLNLLKKDVDDFFDDVGGTLGEDWKSFRKTYYDEYIIPFESGAMFQARNKDGTGFFRTRDESTAQLFLDNQSAARQYNTIFADDPNMMANLENSVLDDLRANVAPEGIIDDKKLANWRRKKDPVLKELPSINQKVGVLESTQRILTDRQIQLGKRARRIENNSLAKQLEKFAIGDQTADQVITAALKNPKKMSTLVNSIRRDKEALTGLQRNIWDKMSSGTSVETLKFYTDNVKSLIKVFTPEHITHMGDVVYARAITETIKHPKGIAHIPAPLEQLEAAFGMGFPQAGSRLYALKTGRLSKSYLVFEMGKSILYGRARINMNDMMREALYDPDIARDFAKSFNNQQFTEETAKRMGARMFALGLPFLEDPKEEIDIMQVPQEPRRPNPLMF